MKLLLFSLIVSIGCQSGFGAVLFECPPDYKEYSMDNPVKGLKRCYQIFGLSTGGVEFDNARCSGGSLLSLPIGETSNSRLDAFVRSHFAWPTSFPGVWIDLKHSDEDCFQAWHHKNKVKINQCFGRKFGRFAFDQNKLAGKGNCVHMIINRQKHWLGPRWKREDCDTLMPFVCEVVPCPEGSFSCAKEGKLKCFKEDAVICNGVADCDDRSDEDNCPNKSCGATLTGKRGWLTSPNYPHKYDSYITNCIWIIEVGLKEKIALTFVHIDTELYHDHVTIYDGVSDDDVILKEISGKIIEKIPISSSNKVKILFETDGDSQESGFNLTYEVVSTKVLNLTANTTPQHLISPKYPAQYDANRDSDFLITARAGSVITLQFVDFHLGVGDEVIVRDGDNTGAPRIRTFSGTELPHDVLVSYGNAMMVTFHADLDGESKGFKASYIEGCQATIVTGIAALESPGRSSMERYPHNLKCSFNISPPPGKKLSVSFSHDFRTEQDRDTVEVFCGGRTPYSFSGPLSGKIKIKMIEDCSPTLKITFKSDSSAYFHGWRAKVSHLNCPKQTKLPDYMQSRSTEEVGINTTVTYRCKEGFEVIGVNPQVCGLNGNWLSVAPNCQVKDCGKPEDIKNGSHRPYFHQHTYGGIEEYICNEGFHLPNINDDGKRKCTMSGWEEPLPRCEEILCPDLKKMVQVPLKVAMPGRSYNSIAKYSCGKGFRLTTHDEITICHDDASWSGGIPDCEKIQCSTGDVNAEYGEVPQKMVDIGSTITVKCVSGFEVVSGQGTATCKENGDFDNSWLKCRDIDECKSQNNPCNPGTCKNTLGGFYCLCSAGYTELYMNRTLQGCTDIDECQDFPGSCSDVCKNTVGSYQCECPPGFSDTEGSGQCNSAEICPVLTAPDQGTIKYIVPPGMDQDKIGVNTTAELRCSKGYTATPTDKDKIPVCLSGGNWSNTLINCEVINCQLEVFDHFVTYTNRQYYQSLATYSCKAGYTLVGNKVRVCDVDPTSNISNPIYRFSGQLPVCRSNTALCSVPKVSGVLRVNVSSDNQSVTYFCEKGYTLVGQSSSECLMGNWRSQPPVCVLADENLYCELPTLPINGASFSQGDMKYHNLEYTDELSRVHRKRVATVGSKINVTCKPGYQYEGDELICIGRNNVQGLCSISKMIDNLLTALQDFMRFRKLNVTYQRNNSEAYCTNFSSSFQPDNCSLDYWSNMYKLPKQLHSNMTTQLHHLCRQFYVTPGIITVAENTTLPCAGDLDDYFKALTLLETKTTTKEEVCSYIANNGKVRDCLQKSIAQGFYLSIIQAFVAYEYILEKQHKCYNNTNSNIKAIHYCDLYPSQLKAGSPGSCTWYRCKTGDDVPKEEFSICHPPNRGQDYGIMADPYGGRSWRSNQSKTFWRSGSLGHWFSRDPPACVDRQTPVFSYCPHSIGPSVSEIDKIIKNLKDNIDPKPSVRVLVSSPDIPAARHVFRNPADLKSEDIIGSYLTFVATDHDGNIATCSVLGPSKMYCSRRGFTRTGMFHQEQVHINNSGFLNVKVAQHSIKETFQTPNASGMLRVPSQGELMVIAVDHFGVNITCKVRYKIMTAICANWTLNLPEGGGLNKFTRITATSANATVTCPTSNRSKKYTCKSGKWYSSDNVPSCSKVFDPVEVEITIRMTSYYSASVFLGNTTNACLMSYFQQEFILSNKSAPTSCGGIGFDGHFFSKGGTEQIPMNSTVRITYKPRLTNERVKTCAQEVITLLQTHINNNISVNVSKSCPENFTIMIQKAEKTAVSYSKCYNHNAFHQNLSFVIDTTSTLAVPLGTILNCTLDYLKIKFASVGSLQCQGIRISLRYHGFGSTGSLKASIVGRIGIFSRTSNITMNSLKNCWQTIVNQTNELKDKSVSLTVCASTLRAKISNVTERDNFCDPGKVPWHKFDFGQYCPAGMYASDDQCHQCPPGSTSELGATACSLTGNGIEVQCKPGTYSLTGFEPCDFCPRGSYTESYMSRTCTACPCKQMTPRLGATSKIDCGAASDGKMYCLEEVIQEKVFNRLQTTGHPQVIASGSYINVTHNRDTSIPLIYGKQYKLSATAFAKNGTSLTCNYTYSIESRFCSPDSLIIPDGVRIKHCSPANAIDKVAENYTCSFECVDSTGFIYPGGEYQCRNRQWSPSQVVMPCAPAKDVLTENRFALTVRFKTSQEASAAYSSNISYAQSKLKNITDQMNTKRELIFGCPIKLHVTSLLTAAFNGTPEVIIFIGLATNLPIKYLKVGSCPQELSKALVEITNKALTEIKIDFFPSASGLAWYSSPKFFVGCNQSFEGSFRNGSYCIKCPPGTYKDLSKSQKCIQIPKHYYYSNSSASGKLACPNGMSTQYEQSMKKEDCLDDCKLGSYSPTGFEPCYQCEKGASSAASIATVCHDNCQAPCDPGTYSETGSKPCKDCPLHHTSSIAGSNKCSPCPSQLMTMRRGSSKCTEPLMEFQTISNGMTKNTSFDHIKYVGDAETLEYDAAYLTNNNVTITYVPPSGSIKLIPGTYTIQAIGHLSQGEPELLKVVHRFQIVVKTCSPTDTQPIVKNAVRQCQKISSRSHRCNFTCHEGYDVFSTTPPHLRTTQTLMYNCSQPLFSDLKDCVDFIIRRYRLEISTVFNSNSVINSTCVQSAKYEVMKKLTSNDLAKICIEKYPETKGMKVKYQLDSLNVFATSTTGNKLTVKITLDIEPLSRSGNNSDDCLKLIRETLQQNRSGHVIFATNHCPRLSLQPDYIWQPLYICPSNTNRFGFSSSSSYYCAMTSSGVRHNVGACRGSYQDETGHTLTDYCKICPPGTLVHKEDIRQLASSFDDCLVLCDQYGLKGRTTIPPCNENPMFSASNNTFEWYYSCDPVGTAFGQSNISNNRDVPCTCKPNFSGKYCEINLRKTACDSSPCMNGGRCFVTHLDEERGYKCYCPAEFEGLNCEKNVDDCTTHGCKHGTCLDGNSKYYCHCDKGYKGYRCDVAIDACQTLPCVSGFCERRFNGFYCNCEGTPFVGQHCNETHGQSCNPNPCLNGGQCVEFANNSTFEKCACKNGTSGELCQTVDSPCKQSPCKNEAYCLEEANNSYSCICKFGSRFTGKHCDEAVTLCSRKPCKHNGTCQMNGSVEYNCSCPLVSGHQVYFGRNCEAVKPCEINPCKYGKCMVEGQGWKCKCSSGFQGQNCNRIKELCKTKDANGNLPCKPNSSASCTTVFINNNASLKCQCNEGWQGKHCEKDIDECLTKKNLCLNNATCINLHADFRCDCTPGWSGKLCGNLINSCTTPKPPCQNNGTCIRKKVGFECRCLAEWMGERCEKDVDECNSTLTCQNGGICNNTVGGYSCTCATGYEGEACVNMTNMCTSSPCKNGGICTTFLNGYNCTCPEEYEGNNCENVTDDCPPEGEKPCGVNGVCVDGWGTYSCKCNYEYAGSKCSKQKLPFDLVFGSFNSTSTASKAVSLSSTDSLSIEFWVRFGNVQGNETFMTITLEDQQSSSRRDVLVYYGGGVTLTTFADRRTIKDPVNSATWKYVVLIIGGGKVTLYQNGQKRLDESQSFLGMQGRLHVTLGTPLSARSRKGFAGEISRLNIYQRIISLTEINNVVNNCNLHKRNGDILSWLMFDTNLTNVERIEPSICGTSKCKEGYKGADCSILIDVTPPEVLSCPDTIVKVNATHRLDHVTWPRPSFTDNVGIVRTTMNHRIGEVFAYGEYAIIYVAYDREGNSAICQFKVFVLAAHCPEPTPPYNGMVAYGTLPWVKFAQIACKNFLFSFASPPPPPFYSCLADGSWFPTKAPNQPLVYPSCIENFPPIIRLIFGWLNIPIDNCSKNRKTALSKSLESIINVLDGSYNICEGACKAEITVECGGVATSGGRKKRQTTTDKLKALLTYDMPNIKIDRLVIEQGSNLTYLLDELLKMIKDQLPKESGLKNATVDEINIDTTPTCPPGNVLGIDKCVNCTQGTFYKQMGKVHICVDCPQGFYQDKVAQTNCTTCGIGKTTMRAGSRNASQCFAKCLAGHYYNQEEKRCIKCSLGYYQDKIGTFWCLSCANGKTTQFTGAKSQNSCTATCGLGYEIETNGNCKACPIGTYRSQINQTACLQCPYSDSTIYLTANVGSTSESQCTVVMCQAGHYRETDGCYPCQLGMYQPSMSTNASCIRCPKGMTTLSAKSTSKNKCMSGAVDECLFETHDCHINAICSDTADSFVCKCKDGFEGNGRNCLSALKCTLECKNGGTCKTNFGVQVCDCPNDYSGNLCVPPDVSLTIIIISSVAGVIGFIFIIVVIGVCILKCRQRRRKDTGGPTHDPNRLGSQQSLQEFAKPEPRRLYLDDSENLPYRGEYNRGYQSQAQQNLEFEDNWERGTPTPPPDYEAQEMDDLPVAVAFRNYSYQ